MAHPPRRAFAARFRGPQFFHRFGHRANMFGRGAAAAADHARAEFGGFLREERKIFRRRVAGKRCGRRRAWEIPRWAWRKAARSSTRQARAESAGASLRADGAVRADGLDVFFLQLFPRVLRARAAERGAFLGVGHLRDDGQPRERADGVHRGEQFFDVAESFEQEKIHAALFQRAGLLLENGDHLNLGQVRGRAARFPAARSSRRSGLHVWRLRALRGRFLRRDDSVRPRDRPCRMAPSLWRFAPKVLVSIICAPASM